MVGRLALSAVLLVAAQARAEDRPSAPPAGPAAPAKAADVPKAVPDAEAAPLAEALKKAWKAKTLEDALPALQAIAGKANPAFEAPLGKLLVHPLGEVASRAAEALGERAGPKTGALLWRSGWLAHANQKRPEVQAAVLAAMGKAGVLLDAKQYDEVESLWRKTSSAKVLVRVAGYFATVKTDKRPLRLLCEALDEPLAASVNSASNPPASYWETRWKLWQATKPAVQEAIHAVTGQTFETSAEAKAWFEANRKTFGFDW